MPIRVTCPVCATRAEVPDSAAGSVGHCRRCGARVQVPAPPVQCSQCQTPLNPKAAQRDPQGRAYCSACWQARVQQLCDQIARDSETAPLLPYRQHGFHFDYPSGWSVRRMDPRSHTGGLRVSAPWRGGSGAAGESSPGEVLIRQVTEPGAGSLGKVLEAALAHQRQERPGFVWRERLPARKHLAGGGGDEAIYLPRDGFEYDWQQGSVAWREQVIVIGDDRGPAYVAAIATATARRELWQAYQPAFERIIDSIRLSTPAHRAV